MTPSREPLVPSVFVNVANPGNVDVDPVYLPFIRDNTHLGSQGVPGLVAPVDPHDLELLLSKVRPRASASD